MGCSKTPRGIRRLAATVAALLVTLAGAKGTTQTLFPLKVSPNGRYLVDQAGTPFYVNGEAAWSITHNYTSAEALTYLANRRAKGFNALIISVPDAYARDGGASYPPDRQGQQPFVNNDITRPNEAYWQNVDAVLNKAEEMGFLVLYWPFYLGCCGDGYGALFQQNGAAKARTYGQFVGARYGGHANLIWVHGGDHDPAPWSDLVLAVKQGIQDVGPARLHGTHWAPETDPYAPYGESFMDLYLTYTYNAVAAKVSTHYGHAPTKPVLLLETHYENDWAGKTWDEVIKYPYRAVLSGAGGYFFGNKPLWFSGFGWETALESPASKAMEWVGDVFGSRPWQTLVPAASAVIPSGGGNPLTDAGVQAARATNGAFALAFLPSRLTVQAALGQISGSTVRAWWFNVATGVPTLIGTFPASGTQAFTPPATGSWLLVLDDASRAFPAPGALLGLKTVSPVSGPTAGGTTVTLTGTGFPSGATVTFNGAAASAVNVLSSTAITAVTPPGAKGLADVTVTFPGPTTATLPQSFFYATPGPATGFFTLAPCRLADTRAAAPLASQERRVFQVAGLCNVPPATDSVAINLTVTQPAAPGHLRAAPGNGLTDASALNFSLGQTRANNAIVQLATDGTGSLSVKNVSGGTAHVVIDVYGYFK